MKSQFILLVSVLAMSTAPGQSVASDARDEQLLMDANRSAIAAARAYGKQPNGTTHALADVAYCNLSELHRMARIDQTALPGVDKNFGNLQRLRATVKLPSVECATHSVAGIPVQVAKADRAIAGL